MNGSQLSCWFPALKKGSWILTASFRRASLTSAISLLSIPSSFRFTDIPKSHLKFHFLWVGKSGLNSVPFSQKSTLINTSITNYSKGMVIVKVSLLSLQLNKILGGMCVCTLVAQLCPALCSSTDCTPSGFSVHGILQARKLGWVAMPFSKILDTLYQIRFYRHGLPLHCCLINERTTHDSFIFLI